MAPEDSAVRGAQEGLEERAASAALVERVAPVDLVLEPLAAAQVEQRVNYQEHLGGEELLALHLSKTPVSISSSLQQQVTRLAVGLSLEELVPLAKEPDLAEDLEVLADWEEGWADWVDLVDSVDCEGQTLGVALMLRRKQCDPSFDPISKSQEPLEKHHRLVSNRG